jgi:hypothetical protein
LWPFNIIKIKIITNKNITPPTIKIVLEVLEDGFDKTPG